jgi:flagellar operon protein
MKMVKAVGSAPDVSQVKPVEIRREQESVADFSRVLDSSLQFSKHVTQRIARRQLDMNVEQIRRLEGAVDKAAAKGAKESLVLLENLAVLVSVDNRTVITAMDKSNMREGIFTQIDSAIVM